MKYSTSLDGVRAIAVLAVVLLHYTWLSAGWVGVRIFFVLSGFLITSILLNDSRRPFREYITRFYWRRTLRIFPLYYAYLVAFGLAFLAGFGPHGFQHDWAYLFTYSYNYRYLFDAEPSSHLFGHFWSLSVEEQFYLLWPTVVFFVPRKAFGWALLAIVVTAPIIRLVATAALSERGLDQNSVMWLVNHMTISQLDGFAIGAAVALYRERLDGLELRTFVIGSFVLLALGQLNAVLTTGTLALNTTLGYPDFLLRGKQYVWGYTALYLWSATLIMVALRPNLISSLLSFPPLTYVGRISYGVYVYHIAVLTVVNRLVGVRHGVANIGKFLFFMTAVLAVASASYRWFETPFLRMKDRVGGSPGQQPSVTVA